MSFPQTRLRRLRQSPALRSMVRETIVLPQNLMAPLFVVPGTSVKKEISSMSGQFHLSVDQVSEQAKKLRDLGIPSVLLFGIPESKDDTGSAACDHNGVVQQAIRALKKEVPDILVASDLCFCEYTSHGHCGIIENGDVDNDKTLSIIVEQTRSHARAGADIIAPSGMIDGTVGAMRHSLDESGFKNTVIMAYAAKFASSFYGPFREAVQSTPEFGDRKTYQMDPANGAEAVREAALDIEEGADIVMVKPALAYLDVIRDVKNKFSLPTAAYNVSGEYAMVKSAAAKGWIDGQRVMCEVLTSIKRAGADIVITYFAEEFAELYQKRALPQW